MTRGRRTLKKVADGGTYQTVLLLDISLHMDGSFAIVSQALGHQQRPSLRLPNSGGEEHLVRMRGHGTFWFWCGYLMMKAHNQ